MTDVTKPGTTKVLYADTKSLGTSSKMVVKDGQVRMYRSRGERVTIAVMYDYSANQLHYGISICSPYDNFDRKRGQKEALRRLKEGFGVVPYSMDKPSCGSKGMQPIDAASVFLSNLKIAVEANHRKFKKRLIAHNLSHPIKEKTVEKEPKRNKYILVGQGNIKDIQVITR